MKKWCTEIEAIDPIDGKMKKYCGPDVPGISQKDAETYCQTNGLGFCKIVGELIADIPCKSGTYDPDFENTIDYEQPTTN